MGVQAGFRSTSSDNVNTASESPDLHEKIRNTDVAREVVAPAAAMAKAGPNDTSPLTQDLVAICAAVCRERSESGNDH